MRKIYILALVLLHTSVTESFAQGSQKREGRTKKDKKEKHKKEHVLPENIEAQPAVFALRPKYILPLTLFDVTNKKGDGLRFNYVPFIQGVVGAGIKIKSVYVAYSVKLPTAVAFEKKMGKTEYQDIDVTIQTRVTGIRLFYQDYKGFYLLSPEKYYPNWKANDSYPQKNNLHILNAGLNLTFVFNNNFSLNAAFAQSERQKKSRGSFMMGITERYTSISCDTSIVPTGQGRYYPTLDKYKTGNFYSSILSVGFGYSIVGGRFNFTPVLLAGTGLLAEGYQLKSGNRLDLQIPVYFNAKTALGYNGKHVYTNVIFNSELNSLALSETRLRVYKISVEFGLGIRF